MNSEKIDQIIPAMLKAQASMGTAKKSADNPFFKSKYADLATVQEVIEKPLAENGLVVTQGAGMGPHGNYIFTTVYHASSGQWFRSEFPMILSKQDAQGIGSCTTYLRRYGLCAMFNIAQEDDDGNAASDQSENKFANSANVGASTQKAGAQRANQIKEYHEASFLTDKEIKDALIKHKADSVKNLPKDVADQLINQALDREIMANEKKGAK